MCSVKILAHTENEKVRKMGKVAYILIDRLIAKEQAFYLILPNNDGRVTSRNTEINEDSEVSLNIS